MKYVVAGSRVVDYYWIVDAENEDDALEKALETKPEYVSPYETWDDEHWEAHTETSEDGRSLIRAIKRWKRRLQEIIHTIQRL